MQSAVTKYLEALQEMRAIGEAEHGVRTARHWAAFDHVRGALRPNAVAAFLRAQGHSDGVIFLSAFGRGVPTDATESEAAACQAAQGDPSAHKRATQTVLGILSASNKAMSALPVPGAGAVASASSSADTGAEAAPKAAGTKRSRKAAK